MKNNDRIFQPGRWLALFLSLLLSTALLFPGAALAAEAEDGVFHIQTQADLEELAELCRLDTWSQGKTVVLDNDLALDEDAESFLPIPTFSGTFQGGGHTISGLSLDGETANAGLFDTLQADAVVNDLTVVGQAISNGGDTIGGIAGRNYGTLVNCSFEGAVQGSVSVGGLVGINETTGQITGCQFQGTVTGEHYVGGIVGQNTGTLTGCENTGDINTTAVEVSGDFSDLSLLGTTESVPAGTDIGGIAGFSSGVIQNCTNSGNVGYEHMGYNVGGIVGRQAGYLDGSNNTGSVCGRKDVGGIAGQLEPQVTLRYNEDLLDQLWVELDTLQGLTNQAAADAQASSSALSGSINSLISNISSAKDAVSGLSGALTDWSNDSLEQANDLSSQLAQILQQAGQLLTESGDAAGLLQDAASLLAQAASTVTGSGESGNTAATELQSASEDLQSAAASAENCATHLNSAVEIAGQIANGEDSADALQRLQEEWSAAESEAQNAKTSVESALAHAEAARGELESLGEPDSAALNDLIQAMDSLNQGLSSLDSISSQIAAAADTLTQQSAVSFPLVDSNVTSQGDALDAALAQMLNSASGLQNNISASSNTLLGDFEAINGQITVIVDLLQQQTEETKEKDAADSFEDISDEDLGEPASGKICNAVNSGEVFGDVNVAGIVGSMSLEYDFDPEDDLTQDGTRSLDFQYKTLAVVTGCTNEGDITAKKDYVGGIVGRMDLGAVKACESYSQVESSGGNYVGGIAGLSRATIRDCFVKCPLSGGDYMGGVVGATTENTVVSGCYTLVELLESGQYAGAISGTEDGEFSGNYYVSDTLAGLGRISYGGKAEPLSFEALTQVSGIPAEMTQFTLRFLVEGEEIKSLNFSYGDSFNDDVFPEIPAKDGCYASWDTDNLTELHFDKTVTAEYSRYVLTLPSEVTRESGRSVFLVDGSFDAEATLAVSQTEATDLVHGKKAEEQWVLQCSDTSQDSYTIRYLSPEEDPDGCQIYIRQDGHWEKANCTSFGSYLVFSVSTAETELAVVHSSGMWMFWLLLGAGVLIGLGVLILILRMHPRKKKRRPSGQSAPNTHPLPEGSQQPGKQRKKRWVPLLILAVLVLAAGAFAAWKLSSAVNAYDLLTTFANQPESAMTLSLDTELDEQLTHMEMEIHKTQVDGHSVTRIQNGGISLYYADGAVLMENGNAYLLSDLYPDYSQILQEAAQLFHTVSFSTTRSGGTVTYQLTAEGENAKALLRLLIPEQLNDLSDTQKLTLTLTADGDTVKALEITSVGTLVDDEQTQYSISAQLQPQELEGSVSVPEAVQETIRSGATEGQTPISEELFLLLSAWSDLNQEESFSADLLLKADCGPISLDEDLDYEQFRIQDQKIGCIRKNELAVYCSDGVFCDQHGTLLSEQDTELADRTRLLDILRQICLNGTFEFTDTGNDSCLYTMALDEAAMEQVACAAVPEIESMLVSLTSGSIQLTVQQGAITDLRCSCTGTLAAAPVTITVQAKFTHNSGLELPNAVRVQLCQEGTEEYGE